MVVMLSSTSGRSTVTATCHQVPALAGTAGTKRMLLAPEMALAFCRNWRRLPWTVRCGTAVIVGIVAPPHVGHHVETETEVNIARAAGEGHFGHMLGVIKGSGVV